MGGRFPKLAATTGIAIFLFLVACMSEIQPQAFDVSDHLEVIFSPVASPQLCWRTNVR
jgi:hypothetical protein